MTRTKWAEISFVQRVAAESSAAAEANQSRTQLPRAVLSCCKERCKEHLTYSSAKLDTPFHLWYYWRNFSWQQRFGKLYFSENIFVFLCFLETSLLNCQLQRLFHLQSIVRIYFTSSIDRTYCEICITYFPAGRKIDYLKPVGNLKS